MKNLSSICCEQVRTAICSDVPRINVPNRPLPRTKRRQRPVFVADAHLLVSCRSSSRVSTRTSSQRTRRGPSAILKGNLFEQPAFSILAHDVNNFFVFRLSKTSVLSLLFWGGPFAILRGIAFIVVDPFNGQPLSISMGVSPFLECRETLGPIITDRNASCSIIFICWAVRIEAASFHGCPYIIQLCPFAAVLSLGIGGSLFLETATALCVSTAQTFGKDILFITAITSATVDDMSSFVLCSSDDGKTAYFFACQINSQLCHTTSSSRPVGRHRYACVFPSGSQGRTCTWAMGP